MKPSSLYHRVLFCTAAVGAAMAAGCMSPRGGAPETTGPELRSPVPDDVVDVAAGAPQLARVTTNLRRGLHTDPMTEIVLDPSGQAALTLDDRGGLRLWPDVSAASASPPIVLPEQDASWFTIARADGEAFVVATIDTVGGARVARIELTDHGARRRELFTLPASDPQFEIHALDGGRRFLALGKDHRIRLFDDTGVVVSEIDEAGFVPWQLRVVQTPSRPVAAAVVLTQPVRAQALTLENDALHLVGEPWMVALDQSPNRNEMALSPDGTTIAALRRHGKRGRGFALQLIELATGNRRVIVGELDDRARPRLHYADDERVLLESGTGNGFWIELAQAVPRDAQTFPPAVMTKVPLPGAAGDLRMQVCESAGVRAVASGDSLLIDPLDDQGHLRITRLPLHAGPAALDGQGQVVAWAEGNRVFIDTVGDATAKPAGFDASAAVQALAFDQQDRLVVVTAANTSVWGRDGSSVPSEPPVRPPPFDAKTASVAAQAAGRSLALRGRTPRVSAPSPDGSLIAVALTTDQLARSDRPSTAATLGVFAGADGEQLWSSPLSRIDVLAWSRDGHRIAVHDGTALVVHDARSGEIVFRRDAAGVQVDASAD